MNHSFSVLLFIIFLTLASCDKGYDVRFTNFYLEPVDSVVIGQNKVVFTNIEVKATTSAMKMDKGDYSVTCITKSKKHFGAELSIPKKGSGVRTLQIDGLGNIIVLEE